MIRMTVGIVAVETTEKINKKEIRKEEPYMMTISTVILLSVDALLCVALGMMISKRKKAEADKELS